MSSRDDHVQRGSTPRPDPLDEARSRAAVPGHREKQEREEEYDEGLPQRSNRFDGRSARQRREDSSHLTVLSILFYVMGGLVAVMTSFFLIYVGVGVAMVNGWMPPPRPGEAVPPALGWVLIAFGGSLVLIGWLSGLLLGIAGYCLGSRRAYAYCFVMACLVCLSVPLGTVLGVFTLLVLLRPSVKDVFAERRAGILPNDSLADEE